MIVIGEKINTSAKIVAAAVESGASFSGKAPAFAPII
jgi:hypothetical protein